MKATLYRAVLVSLLPTIFSSCRAYRIGDLKALPLESQGKFLGKVEVVTNDLWKNSSPETRELWRNYFASALRDTKVFSEVIPIEAPSGRNVVAYVGTRNHSFGAPILVGFTLGLIPAPGYNSRGFVIEFKHPKGREIKLISGGDVSEVMCWWCFLWALSPNWTTSLDDLYPRLVRILRSDLGERTDLELLFNGN